MAIRLYREGDRPALYEVCLRTGADGDDASGLYQEPDLLGAVFVGVSPRNERAIGFYRHLGMAVHSMSDGGADHDSAVVQRSTSSVTNS